MDILEVASLLKDGNIIGVLRGNSEVGPRALGNRSILCDPSFLGMKDKLNKIKNREWFRPFAPIVKFEDREKYFNFNYDSRFMSFSPTAKVDAINVFPSIAHVDNTARVQTVTQQQNNFLYNLLDKVGGPLINTSLNINGEPMITSIEQGLHILNSTSLDYLIVNDIIIKNKNI
jgi:carbamoyltransferase